MNSINVIVISKSYKKLFPFLLALCSFEVVNAPTLIQLELIAFQNDSVLKNKYRQVKIPKIYSYLGDKYTEIKNFAAQFLYYFGSTYLSNYFLPWNYIKRQVKHLSA